MEDDKIVIYQTPDGGASIEVALDRDTVWLDQYQLSDLYETDRTSITKHIRNIYNSGELDQGSTCAKIAQVQQESKRQINRQITRYNLDMIISLGYRVNSIKGAQFRIWASKVLKDYLVKGYILNEQRLHEKSDNYEALKQTVKLLGKVLDAKALTTDEAGGLLKVITDYTYALDVLDKYDHRKLKIEATHKQTSFVATYEAAKEAIKG